MSLSRRIARANRPKRKAVRLNRVERLEELMLHASAAQLDQMATAATRAGDHEAVQRIAAYRAELAAEVLGVAPPPAESFNGAVAPEPEAKP